MRSYFTTLFELEGKDNLGDVARIVAAAVSEHDVRKVIVFTADGDGVIALRSLGKVNAQIIAVTFPSGMIARNEGDEHIVIGLPSVDRRADFESTGIKIVQGTMPFGILGDAEPDWFKTISSAFGIFGGGVQLCVQGVIMACDAGHVTAGERCLVFTADTALIARAGHSHQFFRKSNSFAVEHILCKPLYYQISRGKRELRIAKYLNREGTPSLESSSEKNVTPPDESSEPGTVPD